MANKKFPLLIKERVRVRLSLITTIYFISRQKSIKEREFKKIPALPAPRIIDGWHLVKLTTINNFVIVNQKNSVMNNINKQITYWKKSAERDWQTALDLFKTKHYDACLFFCHLALEKFLKVWL